MKFSKLSPKQAEIFKFPHENYDALICDGAVRSGKTIMMTISFVLWAMETFNGSTFAICGKTVQSAERNIIAPLLAIKSMTNHYSMTYTRSTHLLTVKRGTIENYIYVFGGKDESSYMLIQGVTLAGVLLDEVALMPRSFVEQAITRTLSVDNSKLWFNCNPENPTHWFHEEWILKAEGKNAKHLHFLMEDNPSLSSRALERAKVQFTGVFYDRYILGQWVKAEGLVYPMFDKIEHTFKDEEAPKSGEYFVSIDYGTVNPCSMGLWCISGLVAYRVDEYYFDSRKKGRQLTDEQYYEALEKLIGSKVVQYVVVDPSAASFIQCIRNHGKFSVRSAKNDVSDGIRYTATYLKSGRLKFHRDNCKDSIREFGLYSWDEKAGQDAVIKENDHAMDEIRYFCMTAFRRKLPNRGFGLGD